MTNKTLEQIQEWQPIETAPKDTPCLCYNGADIYILLDIMGSWKEPANLMELRRQPTHWMPLPTKPENK